MSAVPELPIAGVTNRLGGHVKLARTAGSLLVAALVVGTVAFTGAGTAFADGNGGSFHGDHHHNGPSTLFVSPSGQTSNSDWSCNSAGYSTIGAAVAAASPGATIVVCGGTYHEQVVISQPLSLEGRNNATIDETGVTPTFTVPMPPGPRYRHLRRGDRHQLPCGDREPHRHGRHG